MDRRNVPVTSINWMKKLTYYHIFVTSIYVLKKLTCYYHIWTEDSNVISKYGLKKPTCYFHIWTKKLHLLTYMVSPVSNTLTRGSVVSTGKEFFSQVIVGLGSPPASQCKVTVLFINDPCLGSRYIVGNPRGTSVRRIIVMSITTSYDIVFIVRCYFLKPHILGTQLT